ncbi:hypothetical protein pEaSNUABM5_00130 [Erwinia phage pEa_SNUABM_5]|uniref:Uncharacterized protein n=1 Tax=Erwinia phage pEa_SNUABM_5 TaxID=2797313 RepID=A0A7T8IW06_9CAUD|nr:hypothetical protein MPK73_gp130 [Erwinia phage pEa_SNUABM_5]QQO90272.1 hypothetical protein pEaSNUABM5_00130 [Erwinia phage pEa_SNUABM_5]
MQATAQKQILITHMDGGVPFVTSAVIVAQGTTDHLPAIEDFFQRASMLNSYMFFCMDDEDVEVQEPRKTLVSDYVSIDGFALDLQMIKRVRASVEHDYSCICCSVEEYFRTHNHLTTLLATGFEFEIIPQDLPEADWIEAQEPFGMVTPVFVETPVIEILHNGLWRSGIMLTDAVRMDRKCVIVNRSKGNATVSGNRLYVVNQPDTYNLDYTALKSYFSTYGIFRNVVLTK